MSYLKRIIFVLWLPLVLYSNLNCDFFAGLLPSVDSVWGATITFPVANQPQACTAHIGAKINFGYNIIESTIHPITIAPSFTTSSATFENYSVSNGIFVIILNKDTPQENTLEVGIEGFFANVGGGPDQSVSYISGYGIEVTQIINGVCTQARGYSDPSIISSIEQRNNLTASALPDPVQVCTTIPATTRNIKTPGCWFNDIFTGDPDCYFWCGAANSCWTTINIPSYEVCKMETPPF